MDPHTACAQAVAQRYIKKTGSKVPVVVCLTAHWAKFAKDVYQALNGNSDFDEFEILKKMCKMNPNLKVPKSISSLKTKKVRFSKVCGTDLTEVKKLITGQTA